MTGAPNKRQDKSLRTGPRPVEITNAMIEAGAEILAGYSPREDDPGETAREVFAAMAAASKEREN
jgi:hypothetical protein